MDPPGISTNYLCVKEVNADYYYLFWFPPDGNYHSDLYHIDDPISEVGTINNISVFIEAWDAWIKPIIKINGDSVREGPAELYDGGTWHTKSYKWISQPSTGGAWTWPAVRGLQVGCSVKCLDSYAAVTQVYVVVDYNPNVFSPEIRTSQMYAVVCYTPSETTFYLNKPLDYSISNSRELLKIDTWHKRIVRDQKRRNKTLTMNGQEYDTGSSTATSRLNQVNEIKELGKYVTLSGFDDEKVDTTWLITNFRYDQNNDNPLLWDWTLTLERY